MLQDALPPGGQAQGLFLDPQGRVLAAANAQVAVGDRLEWVAALARHATPPERGHRVRWQGRDFLAGIAYSRGYREFKREDGYREPVLSVMLMPVDTLPARNRAPALASMLPALPSAAMRRYGVVQCGSLLLAIESRHVQQAMSAQRMLNIPGNGQWAGMLEVTHAGMTSMATAYDACRLVGQPALPDPRQAVAVVVHNRQRVVVLLVNQLLGVVTFDTVHPAPANITASAPWITGILTDAAGKALVYVVNPERFDARLMPLPQEMLAPPPAQRTQDDALRT